jgi:hypothetical protein
MKKYVFGIGLPKTGTTSLAAALNVLGVPTVHDSAKLKPIAAAAFAKNQNLFESSGLDTEYQGFADFAGERYYETLYTQYPNSVFIYTKRYFPEWFKSHGKMLRQMREQQMTSEELSRCYLQMVEKYFQKTEEIQNFFRDKPHQYLELDICGGDGWEPLCNFLDLPIPDNTAFPHLNKARTRYLAR